MTAGVLVGALAALQGMRAHAELAGHLNGMVARLGDALLDATATSIESSVAATSALNRALTENVRAKATFLSGDSARAPRLLERFARAAGLQHVLLLTADGRLFAAVRDVPTLGGSDNTARVALDAELERAARNLAESAGEKLHVQRWSVPAAGIEPSLAVVRRLPDGTRAILVQRDTSFRRLRAVADPARQASALEQSPQLAYVTFDAPAPPQQASRPILALDRDLSLPDGRRAKLHIGVDITTVHDALALQRRSAWIQGLLLALLAFAAVALLTRQRALRHRMEERMRRTERLSALGRLAAHVAHEVRNPLNAIAVGVQRVGRKTERDDVRRITDSVLVEVDRLDRTVAEVLQTARPRPPRLERVVAVELADSLRELAVPTAAARSVELTVEAPAGLAFQADADLVRGAVWNLLRNAMQVSPERSDVSLRIERVEQTVRIAVSDRGPGLDEEHRARAFEPFASSRPGGTGLGLALTLAAAQAHGGTVEVEARAGGGTTFVFLLTSTEDAS